MGAAAAPLQAGLWLLWQGDYHNDILRRLVGRDGGRGLGRKEKRKERGRDKRGSASGAWVRRGPGAEAARQAREFQGHPELQAVSEDQVLARDLLCPVVCEWV